MKVYYGTNFWGSSRAAERKAAKEVGETAKKYELLEKVTLNQEFIWGDISGFIPAIYVGSEGMAVDLCIRVSNEAYQTFYDKWKPRLENGLSKTEREQIEAENPMNINFALGASVNGEKLQNDFGCGTCYSKIAIDEYRKGGVEEQLIREYECDESSSWCFKRQMWKWKEQPEQIHNLELEFIAEQKAYPGTQIEVDLESKGKKYDILHPLNDKHYELQISNIVQQEISKEVLEGLKERHDWEYPNQYLIISYAMEPDISQNNFHLKDATEGDSPRNMCAHENGAVSVIVGNVDGPTSIFIAGKRKDKQEMIAVSAMHFEPVAHVSLNAVFMEKEREDMRLRIDLTNGYSG